MQKYLFSIFNKLVSAAVHSQGKQAAYKDMQLFNSLPVAETAGDGMMELASPLWQRRARQPGLQ